MINQDYLDKCYNNIVSNIKEYLPDGLIQIDLDVLHQLGLLHLHVRSNEESNMTRYFHVTETEERLTLVNDEFVIWISPNIGQDEESTYTLIALAGEHGVHLELGFVTRGIYNQSRLVLQILEKYLLEIHVTEDALKKLS